MHESIFHPGHYRVALARTAAQLPKDPEVTIVETEKGPRSSAAVIANPPVAPVLLDGIFAHTIEFMAEHPGIAVDGGHSYHHCAILNIAADPAKPIDTRW